MLTARSPKRRGSGRLVLRDEILARRPARCNRRPSDRRPAAPCPSCRAPAGFRGVCHSSVVARQGLPPACLPLNRLQIRLNRNTIWAAPTIKAAMVMKTFSVVADGGTKAISPMLVVAARHAHQAQIVHREEDRVGPEERDPEVELAERLVQHAPGDLRIPMVDRAETRRGSARRPSPCGNARRRTWCPRAARPRRRCRGTGRSARR